jgi:hypothetical protein
MSHTITIRLSKELAEWLAETSKRIVAFVSRRDAHHEWELSVEPQLSVYRRNKRESIPLICPPEARIEN